MVGRKVLALVILVRIQASEPRVKTKVIFYINV